MMKPGHRLACVCLLTALACSAHAAQKMCVFDFLGTGGDMYSMAKDYVLAMQRYGADLELRAFVNEAQATEEFKNGNCDALVASGFRTRQFNAVAASTDSLGATTILRDGRVDTQATYEVMRKLIQTYASVSPQVTKLMWVDIEPEAAVKYTLLLRESRIALAQQGLYDKRGLKVLKRIRCNVNPADPECATQSEEDWK